METSSFRKKFIVGLLVVLILVGVALVIFHQHDFVADQDIDPTCTEDGFWSGTCKCGETYSEVLPATGHALTTVQGYDSTCTEVGLKTYQKCANCDYSTFTPECIIAAKGHKCAKPETVTLKKASCTEDGAYQIVKVCDVCDVEYSREDYVEEHKGHDYITIEAKAATCIPGHYEYYICKVCYNVLDYVEIPAAYDHISSVHPIVYWPSVIDATCTVAGSYQMAVCCTNDECDYLFGELSGPYVIEPLGHNIKVVPGSAPTCTSIGSTPHEECTRCSYVNGVGIIAALGHDMYSVDENPATCTTSGHSAYTACSRCSHRVDYDYYPAFGHTDGEIKIENLVEPTCVEWGSYDRVIRCVTCNVVRWEEHWDVEPVIHNELATIEAKAPTCTEYGWVEYIGCAKCGYVENFDDYKIPETGHTLVNCEGKAPECFVNGYYAYEKCTVCDYTTYEEIPAAGHHSYGADGYCQNPVCSAYMSLNLEYKDNGNGTWTVVGLGSCTDTAISIPDVYMGAPVVAIAEKAFYNNDKITAVYIPYTVKVIGGYSFYRCKNLTTVVIGDGVETIGEFAFFSCTNLTSVTIGSGLKVVGNDAFNGCDKLSEVNYHGSEAAWYSISFGGRNDKLTGAYRKYI